MGPKKIEGYLKQRGFNVPHNRIYRVICEEDLNNPITAPRLGARKGSNENILTVSGRLTLSSATTITG